MDSRAPCASGGTVQGLGQFRQCRIEYKPRLKGSSQRFNDKLLEQRDVFVCRPRGELTETSKKATPRGSTRTWMNQTPNTKTCPELSVAILGDLSRIDGALWSLGSGLKGVGSLLADTSSYGAVLYELRGRPRGDVACASGTGLHMAFPRVASLNSGLEYPGLEMTRGGKRVSCHYLQCLSVVHRRMYNAGEL